jgi:hypothetical protein
VIVASGPPYTTYLPFVSTSFNCTTGSSYSAGVAYRGEWPPILQASQHPDKNLAIRSYLNDNTTSSSYSATCSVGYDTNAPKLYGLLSPALIPGVSNLFHNYQVYDWNGAMPYVRGAPLVTGSMVSFSVSLGATIYVPPSGYSIGQGMEVLVLYADSSRITLKFGRDDTAGTVPWDPSFTHEGVGGYVIHIEGICVDPNLVSLYQSVDAYPNGPRYTQNQFTLPNLASGQPIGKANHTTFGVAIRDSGTFEDARLKDWWAACP